MKQLFFIFIASLFLFQSCQKDSRVGKPIGSLVKTEAVQQSLIQKFTDYNIVMEKQDTNLDRTISMPKPDFEAMIANFLVLERNEMIKNPGKKPNLVNILRVQNAVNCVIMGVEQPCPTPTGGTSGQVSCTGSFVTPNSVGTIVFVAQLNAMNTGFTKTDYGFGGVTGTWTKIGETGTTYYNGVISYTQYYTESYTMNGVSYNQTYMIYGSATQSSCTTHGTRVVSAN